MTDIPVTNTFQQRNWMVDKMTSRKYSQRIVFTEIEGVIATIVEQEWGHHPFKSIMLRKREFVVARQLYMTMLAKYTGRSLSEIGHAIRKHHATIIHGCKTINNLYQTDKDFRVVYDNIDLRVKKLVR